MKKDNYDDEVVIDLVELFIAVKRKILFVIGAFLACCDFILDLPDGLLTVLGEQGMGLSEGQLQRIAIARSIYAGAPILLLDESTSALDDVTEAKVLKQIKALTDKTVIIVTHRSAAVKLCDRELNL